MYRIEAIQKIQIRARQADIDGKECVNICEKTEGGMFSDRNTGLNLFETEGNESSTVITKRDASSSFLSDDILEEASIS